MNKYYHAQIHKNLGLIQELNGGKIYEDNALFTYEKQFINCIYIFSLLSEVINNYRHHRIIVRINKAANSGLRLYFLLLPAKNNFLLEPQITESYHTFVVLPIQLIKVNCQNKTLLSNTYLLKAAPG